MDMTKKKCPQCGLVNFSTDMECRRCGSFLGMSATTHSVSEQKKSQLSSALLALIAFLLVAGGIWYWSSKTNSNQPVVYNPENLPQTKITPVPEPTVVELNINDHPEIKEEIEPMEKRIERIQELRRQTAESFKNSVKKPFAR
jgi:uncharacterized Zn finger protein (UPF0148 family)